MESISNIVGVFRGLVNVSSKFVRHTRKYLLIIPKDETWRELMVEVKRLIIEIIFMGFVIVTTMLNHYLLNMDFLSFLNCNENEIYLILLLIVIIHFSNAGLLRGRRTLLVVESARILLLDILWLRVFQITGLVTCKYVIYIIGTFSVFVCAGIYKWLSVRGICFNKYDKLMKILQVLKWMILLVLMFLILRANRFDWISRSIVIACVMMAVVVCLVQFFYLRWKDTARNVLIKIYMGEECIYSQNSILKMNGMLSCIKSDGSKCLICENIVDNIEFDMRYYPPDTICSYLDVKCILTDGKFLEFDGGKKWNANWFYFWKHETDKTVVKIIPNRRIQKVEGRVYKIHCDERKKG